MEKSNKTIALKNIGCKLNFAEISTIGRTFEQQGFEIIGFNEPANVYVMNTCSVTANAVKDCRKAVRQALRSNPDAFIAMVGCLAQLQPDQTKALKGVDVVLGNDEKYNLFEHYQNFINRRNSLDYHYPLNRLNIFHASHSTDERTRSFLKIQDGCDYECTYCTIPLARGKSRSDSIINTLQSAQEIANTNTKEIVLTGVNTGDYGRGTKETFFELITKLDDLTGIERIRISSIEPNLLTNEMIDFIATSKLFVPHFHIPLQSGSNKLLSDMRRRYKRELYADKIEKIKSTIPDCCIGVDVIVGFPTETASDFQQTYDYLNNLDITYLHVFPYSARDNTKALEFKNIVTNEQKANRGRVLRELSNKKLYAFQNKFIGQTKIVLFESLQNGQVSGHTDNYIKVKTKASAEFVNQLIPVQLTQNNTDFMVGNILLDK